MGQRRIDSTTVPDWGNMADMRATIYNFVISLPGKIIGTGIGLAGIGASLQPKKVNEWVAWFMTPEQIRFWGIVVIAISLAYWLVVLLLKPRNAQNSAASSPVAKTEGDGSPALSGNFGSVNIFNHAPPDHPPKRVMDIHPHALLAAAGRAVPKPDFPFNGVLGRLYRNLGGAPTDESRKKDFYDKIDREIVNKVVAMQMSVWGSNGKRALELLSMQTLRMGWFDHKDGVFVLPGDSIYPLKFRELMFNMEEVERAWPDASSQPIQPRRRRSPVSYPPPKDDTNA